MESTSPLLKLPAGVLQAAQWIALVLLPAFTTLWLALGPIWGLPAVQEVGATLTAIDAFLGTILGVTAQSLAKAKGVASQASAEALAEEVAALKAELEALKPTEGGEAHAEAE